MTEPAPTTSPSERLEFALFAAAALLVLLVLTNILLATANAGLSRELAAGQQQINEGVRLGRINGQVVRAIAGLAANTSDSDLQLLLARHGITYSVTPKAAEQEDSSQREGGR